MNGISEATVKHVQEIYDPELTLREMGKLIGKGAETVRRALKVLGVPAGGRFKPTPYPVLDLDPIWAAEFRGFFYGEGYAGLHFVQTGMVNPVLSIVLRADDDLVIKDISAHLGGKPYYIPWHGTRMGKPQCRWKVYGFSRVRAIIEATGLVDGLLPVKKRRDIAILYEAILARWGMPYCNLSLEHKQILLKYQQDIVAVRKFD